MRCDGLSAAFAFLVFFYLVVTLPVYGNDSRSVRVSLHASWPATRPHLEAAEWIAENSSPKYFWAFVELFAEHCKSTGFAPSQSDREFYRLVLSSVGQVLGDDLPSSATSIATWAITARLMSPRIHFQRTVRAEILDNISPSSVRPSPSIFGLLSNVDSDDITIVDSIGDLCTLLQSSAIANLCSNENANVNSTIRQGLRQIKSNIALADLLKPLPGDHYYPLGQCSGTQPALKVVLYADPTESQFGSWHEILKSSSEQCEVSYSFRFSDRTDELEPTRPKPALQGFAVEVSLKATEYKVQDDLVFDTKLFDDCPYGQNSCLNPSYDRASSDSDTVSEGKKNDAYKHDVVDTSDLKNLNAGILLADHVIRNAEGDANRALDLLRHAGEEFPRLLAELSRQTTDSHGHKHKIQQLEQMAAQFQAGSRLSEGIFVNGRFISADELFENLERPMSCFAGIFSGASSLRSMLSVPEPEKSSVISGILNVHVDGHGDKLRIEYTKRGELRNVPVWFNNLRKDRRYKSWPSLESTTDLSDFAERVQQNAEEERTAKLHSDDKDYLVRVRSNMLSLLVALDLGAGGHLRYISIVESVVHGLLPLRVGFIVVPTSHESALAAGLFYHCLKIGGLKVAVKFLNIMRQLYGYFGGNMQDMALSEEFVELVYQQLLHSEISLKHRSAREVLEYDPDVRNRLMDARKWAEDIGLLPSQMSGEDSLFTSSKQTEVDQSGKPVFAVTAFLNGVVLHDVVSDTIVLALKEQRRIASLARESSQPVPSDESTDEQYYWLSQDSSLLIVDRVASINRENRAQSSSIALEADQADAAPLEHSVFSAVAHATAERSSVKYIERADESSSSYTKASPVTIWLFSRDESSPQHASAISKLETLHHSGFLQKCGARYATLSSFSRLAKDIGIMDLMRQLRTESLFFVNGRIYSTDLFKSANDLQVIIAQEASGLSLAISQISESPLERDDILLGVLAARDINARCGKTHVHSAFEGSESRHMTDLSHVQERLQQDAKNSEVFLFSSATPAPADEQVQLPVLNMTVVYDPAGRYLSVIPEFLHALTNALTPNKIDLTILLIPPARVQSSTQTHLRFARAVYSARPEFDDSTGQLISPAALLTRLPQSQLLTIGMQTPRAWHVAPFATNYDLDNVMLNSLPQHLPILHAAYAMESLIVEGSCIDQELQPPQGLKLELTNRNSGNIDTIVMANLGYFQLRIPSPGRWLLQIASGRGQLIYDITRIDQRALSSSVRQSQKLSALSLGESGFVNVVVDSFNGARNIILRVTRKQGTDHIPLLDPKHTDRNVNSTYLGAVRKLWQRARGQAKSANANVQQFPAHTKEDFIHVFSVASGHLYERFLKIMMLSVKKHASVPVKFWILENYLSPSFKKVIPHFARLHQFHVQMVTYKWPGWLREQSEKQRIIWAYKILFLDVLFPLNLSRVIFVDSDQVVRADLAELMQMDLHGAPYGYVPFCDSRKEVEGFRFWKSGFWKDTLQGAHYHISALYVVDLDLFRETSAGDTLRFIYQSLSADPNSLSNLDQDLPNYAAVSPAGGGRTVPIFDLPQDWLWCESWCDDASKTSAKTIDLCNNPMTKEPKLTSARRIIGEWVPLDEEAYNTTAWIHDFLSGNHRETCKVEDFTRSLWSEGGHQMDVLKDEL